MDYGGDREFYRITQTLGTKLGPVINQDYTMSKGNLFEVTNLCRKREEEEEEEDEYEDEEQQEEEELYRKTK